MAKSLRPLSSPTRDVLAGQTEGPHAHSQMTVDLSSLPSDKSKITTEGLVPEEIGSEVRMSWMSWNHGGVSQSNRAAICFAAGLTIIDSSTIVRLPEQASRRLPSRGQVAVCGSINGHAFQTVLEPDGAKGHWIKVDQELLDVADIGIDDIVSFAIEVRPDWPEPDVPSDLAQALAAAPQQIQEMWHDITPMARWEWVRWVNATANPATRQRRVEVSVSKMNNGKRRPCCFDLSACTDPALSKNGKLRAAP
jgi:hypothetical protein